MNTTLRLKDGYGYWLTDHLPIGGSFRRAQGAKEIKEIIRTFKSYKGVDTEVRFMDGTRGAVRGEHIEKDAG